VNGKWTLKDTAVPGVGPLFNSALAANESKAVGQVKERNNKIKTLEEENNSLRDRLSIHEQPGTVALSAEDAKTWEGYVALGTPKEIKSKLDVLPELETKIAGFEAGETLSKVSEVVQLNGDVLKDWMGSAEGKGLTFFVKEVEVTNEKGEKVLTKVPFVKIEEPDSKGKIMVSEKELLPFAKEKLPEWKYEALVTVADEKGGKKRADASGSGFEGKKPGVRIPDLGSAQGGQGGEGSSRKKRPVDMFNEQREARPNPFAPKPTTNPAVKGMPEQLK
jgi:hypothetical protein